ncbi:MAG: enoyl-CoA hydratase [Alphaproteobacteria bacterium]
MSTNSEPVLLAEVSGGLAVLTLNRPRAMNALSMELRVELTKTIDRLGADPSVRVMILTGAGQAFTAGLDLKELGRGEARIAGAMDDSNVLASMARFPGPIIGAINGAAITGGFEIALACDVLIASSAARFADTHARLGVMPGWGLSQRLSRAIGLSRAKELSLTGNFLSAAQAENWGLVNRVVAPEELLPAARALAQDMLSAIPEFLIAYKSLMDEGYGQNLATALETEQRVFRATSSDVSAGAIEQRRTEILQRGRSQT